MLRRTQGPSSADLFDFRPLFAVQMGAMMGVGVGLSIGLIGGVVQIARAGPGPKGAMHTLGQFMATSGATFG